MTATIRRLLLSHFARPAMLAAAALLAGCSAAAWQGYGPLGDGFVGSAYGYSEQRLSDSTWQVRYVDAESVAARTNAVRRANEICIENGYARADYAPELSPGRDGTVTASGIATCTRERRTVQSHSERQALEQRLQEIDAEISALEKQDHHGTAGRSGTWMDIVSGAVEKLAGKSTDKRIDALREERETLQQQLKLASD